MANIIQLMQDRFEVRALLGTALLNVGGETFEVIIENTNRQSKSPAYKAIDRETKKVLAQFSCYHMHGGPDMYQIEGISCNGYGDGTLIVLPALHNWLPSDDEEAQREETLSGENDEIA